MRIHIFFERSTTVVIYFVDTMRILLPEKNVILFISGIFQAYSEGQNIHRRIILLA